MNKNFMLYTVRCYMMVNIKEKHKRKKGDMKCLEGRAGH